MKEYFHNGIEQIQVLSQNGHGAHAASPKDALHSTDTKPIFNVTCQSERNGLWNGQQQTLIKGNAQINMYNLSGFHVKKNVVHVTISESNDISDNAAGCHRASVREPLKIPIVSIRKTLHEKVMKDWFKTTTNLLVCTQFFLEIAGLGSNVDEVAALGVELVLWAVPHMSAIQRSIIFSNEILGEWNRVFNPAQNSRSRAERNHLVCPDTQFSSACLLVVLKQIVHHIKELLHHRVLSQIIVSFHQLAMCFVV
mmetsp:Transcript_3499/g.13368  ORF Transcript_3499/g.13368 Transcript_3499/m.13368 type:complete len:253 (+) Transcript_3499:362-1120(+)